MRSFTALQLFVSKTKWIIKAKNKLSILNKANGFNKRVSSWTTKISRTMSNKKNYNLKADNLLPKLNVLDIREWNVSQKAMKTNTMPKYIFTKWNNWTYFIFFNAPPLCSKCFTFQSNKVYTIYMCFSTSHRCWMEWE